MGQSKTAKKIRKEVRNASAGIKEKVGIEILAGFYTMPFWTRVKWAMKIIRGMKQQESIVARIRRALQWRRG